jgi:signal transduction histidine kinase
VEDDPTLTGLEIYCAPLIERVFINFLENARDHGTTVTRVKISFRSEQDIGILIVEDDGIGVQQDKKEVIFSQGYGTKTKFGLYHSREILGMTGITIKETGQEGRCGRFELKIPKEGYRILRGEGSGAI